MLWQESKKEFLDEYQTKHMEEISGDLLWAFPYKPKWINPVMDEFKKNHIDEI